MAGTGLTVGSLWREDDKRFERYVRIVQIGVDSAVIENAATGRRSIAALKRFGRAGGYKLVQADPTPAHAQEQE